jgi:hypothetical protein
MAAGIASTHRDGPKGLSVPRQCHSMAAQQQHAHDLIHSADVGSFPISQCTAAQRVYTTVTLGTFTFGKLAVAGLFHLL